MKSPEPDSGKPGKGDKKRRIKGKDAAERVSFGVLNIDKPLDSTTDEKLFPGPVGQSIDAKPRITIEEAYNEDDDYPRRPYADSSDHNQVRSQQQPRSRGNR